MAIECFYTLLGRLFEPYVVAILPMLLSCSSDASRSVRQAAQVTDISRTFETHPELKNIRTLIRKQHE